MRNTIENQFTVEVVTPKAKPATSAIAAREIQRNAFIALFKEKRSNINQRKGVVEYSWVCISNARAHNSHTKSSLTLFYVS